MTRTLIKLLLFKILALTAGVHASLRESPTPHRSPRLIQIHPEFNVWTPSQAEQELRALVESGEVSRNDVATARAMVVDLQISMNTTVAEIYAKLHSAIYVSADGTSTNAADAVVGGAGAARVILKLVKLEALVLGRTAAGASAGSGRR